VFFCMHGDGLGVSMINRLYIVTLQSHPSYTTARSRAFGTFLVGRKKASSEG